MIPADVCAAITRKSPRALRASSGSPSGAQAKPGRAERSFAFDRGEERDALFEVARVKALIAAAEAEPNIPSALAG